MQINEKLYKIKQKIRSRFWNIIFCSRFHFLFHSKNKELEKVCPRERFWKTHNVYREITRIQQDSVLIKFRKFRWSDCDKRNSVFSVTMKGRVGEGFSLVLPEKARVTENYVINLVAGTFAIKSVPFFLRLLTFSAKRKISIQNFSSSCDKIHIIMQNKRKK